jgi:ABC-type sugar transport system ATPase subunit
VFQDYALYPHLTVRENIAFGLRARKMPAAEASAKAEEAARLLGLDPALDRAPGALSGGERQRVALARALVRRPEAFLLDEPLSNLDAELRSQTRLEIRELQRRLEVTTLYVTHDQVEALTMGDIVVVLRAGRIEQMGPPREVYETPANAFVARFLGSPPMNLLPGALVGGVDGQLVGIRPERLALVTPEEGRLQGVVAAVEHTGAEAVVHVDVAGERTLVRCDARHAPVTGAGVGLGFSDGDIHHFEGPDGKAIR